MSKWLLRASLLLCLGGYVFVYATGRANPPIRSDGYSYYVYLPSWFIYGDATLSAVANDCCGGEFPAFTAIIRWPGTRRWMNAHPIGVAIMQTPFFLTGHALTKWSNLSPDGFTFYYQHAAGISGIFWTVAGLWMLRRLLLKHFCERVAAATLVVVLLGTGLYHYSTYDSTYSHVYSFFLFASFLYLTERWHSAAAASLHAVAQQESTDHLGRDSVLLGLVSGLIVLTRHTNVILLLIFPLYGMSSGTSVRSAVDRQLNRWRELAIMVVVGVAIVFPQLDIYYRATGHAFVSAYGDLSFNFRSPHIWAVLFSVQKGLFFWSPMLLAAVAGFAIGYKKLRPFLLGAAVAMAADTYLIASWWDWQFGASYGHRGFIDTLPLLALGLAAFFEWSLGQPIRLRIVASVTTVAVCLSLFQMLQYWNGVMPMSDLTWDQYRAVFLRLH
jgi:hypothetical protein